MDRQVHSTCCVFFAHVQCMSYLLSHIKYLLEALKGNGRHQQPLVSYVVSSIYGTCMYSTVVLEYQ